MPRQITEIDKIIGKNLQNIRLSKGLSRSALADQIGVTHQSVAKYENSVCRVSLSTALAISKAFKIKLLDLVTGVDDVPDFTELDSKSISLFRKINALSDDEKKRFIKMINSRLAYDKAKSEME